MAQSRLQLSCNSDGICMVCNKTPEAVENVICRLCTTPWHAACLSETLTYSGLWFCPDCKIVDGAGTAAPPPPPPPAASADDASSGLVAAIRAIQRDSSLTEQEKAAKRQELMSGGRQKGKKVKDSDDEEDRVRKVVDDELSCTFCMELPDRPVSTPCGHNFCLRCFEKWIGQGKLTCAKCRTHIPPKMAKQPRINAALVAIIRAAKMGKPKESADSAKLQHFVHNQDRPDKPFTTERAKRAGKANAASGKIFVTTPQDYFGPILPEYDNARGRGVLVGDFWEGRLECRQWGVHLPPVAGIAGQKNHGAQSVVLSGGYEDDEDHGEWFLYTGSGGRDLSGNKRTNKEQSSDQKFDSFNEALRVSCIKGYPVRVVRSYKEKRSSYAPEAGLRYDGIYRIEKCWLKTGKQGFKVCRYLFVRCDNSPAPWTSNEHGDKVRPLPVISELEIATKVTERTESPSWDYDEEEGSWKWVKTPPASKHLGTASSPDGKRVKSARRKGNGASREKNILKGLSCLLCTKVMKLPLTTPCGHNFCKHCLEGHFAGKSHVRERTSLGGRSLRTKNNVMNCPSCSIDISEFLLTPQVNRNLQGVIEGLRDEDSSEEAVVECPSDTEESEDELNLKDIESERGSKKLKIDGVDGLCKMEVADQKESKEAQEARDGEIASPSSTLIIQSDGEML